MVDYSTHEQLRNLIAMREGWCALMNAALNVECYFTKDLSSTISEWELENLRGAIQVAWTKAREVGFEPTDKELKAADHDIELWLQKQDDNNDRLS
jgi:hypothetical protein